MEVLLLPDAWFPFGEATPFSFLLSAFLILVSSAYFFSLRIIASRSWRLRSAYADVVP